MANQHDILGSKNPVRTVFLSWPAILEQILFTAVQYVDTAMVGSWGPMLPLRWGSTPRPSG